jgi:hypothetical protein
VALTQTFSEYFRFPCQAFHRLLHTHYHPSSGTRTIGQIMADVPSGPSLTASKQQTKNKLRGLNPQANYTNRATAACRRSKCQYLRIEGAKWSSGRLDGSLWPYSRLSRPETLFFLPSSSSIVLTRLSGNLSIPTTSEKIW